MKISADLTRLFKIASESDATVLITGPTGTGKTTLAKLVHDSSKRKFGPFVTVNLASLHEGVLESELFGHEKGAFTGAEQRRVGKLELAHGGTVFLDEVSELSGRLQARLLEFLQSRTICPVGSNREVKLDVRVIAATHRDLVKEVQRNSFREDLFHRLRVVSIPLKSLQERDEEFDTIVHDCLRSVAAQCDRSILRISSEVAELFEAYPWPGNVRELRNALEYAVLAAEGQEICVEDLPFWLMAYASPIVGNEEKMSEVPVLGVAEVPLTLNYTKVMADFEKDYLERALTRFKGRISRTSREIGINKSTLIRRMRFYGICSI